MELVESVLRVAPDCLVTIENPRGPWFAGLPVIKRLLADPRWHLMVGSYCKLAGPLDGARAWPRKHTYILAYNVPPLLELPVCRNDCTHLLPGTRRHKVVLCTNKENHTGQHVVSNAMAKGVIPLGLFDLVWKAHLGELSRRRLADRRDARAGESEIPSRQEIAAERKLVRRDERREAIGGPASCAVTRSQRGTVADGAQEKGGTAKGVAQEEGCTSSDGAHEKGGTTESAAQEEGGTSPDGTPEKGGTSSDGVQKKGGTPIEPSTSLDPDEEESDESEDEWNPDIEPGVTDTPSGLGAFVPKVSLRDREKDSVPMRLFDINSGLRDAYAEYQPPASAVHPWARSYPGLQEDMPRYDLLNMPPWSLAFCDDITLAHKVKGGRPRMLLAYDCVTGGIRVKHEHSKADHGPALHEIITEEALDKRPYKVTIGSDGCGSMVHLRNAAKERGLDHWPLPPYAYKLNPVEGAIRHFKESVTCALMGGGHPRGCAHRGVCAVGGRLCGLVERAVPE